MAQAITAEPPYLDAVLSSYGGDIPQTLDPDAELGLSEADFLEARGRVAALLAELMQATEVSEKHAARLAFAFARDFRRSASCSPP